MALESPVSYLPTLESFLNHWESVEAGTGEALVLREGDLAAGRALFSELKTAVAGVRSAAFELQCARAEVREGRVVVRELVEDFNAVVRAYWTETAWLELLPRLPLPGAALDKYLRPCREALRIWEGLEGEPTPPGAPVPLRVGPLKSVGRAEYAAELEAQRLRGLAQEAAEFVLGLRRVRRNAVMRRVRALLVSYARTLPTRVPPGDALVLAMPRLWPLPGHTPDAVKAAGGWLAETNVARLTWSASKDAALDHYQVRVCPGPDYKKEDEAVAGNVKPEAERAFDTAELLGRPGAVACFRVYVVLKTGNERASNVVVVERPG